MVSSFHGFFKLTLCVLDGLAHLEFTQPEQALAAQTGCEASTRAIISRDSAIETMVLLQTLSSHQNKTFFLLPVKYAKSAEAKFLSSWLGLFPPVYFFAWK